jgi:hypothetical protein
VESKRKQQCDSDFLVLRQKKAELSIASMVKAEIQCQSADMHLIKKFPLHPAHPERLCWGCDRYCAADALACGNGSDRTAHPVELFGDDWHIDTLSDSTSLVEPKTAGDHRH